jgi:DNA-directed RNA polymerase specialized sigma24 family protein
MAGSEQQWAWVRRQAAWFLRRHRAASLDDAGEDLVQEATLAAWRWAARPHDRARLWVALRTIVRRLRMRATDTRRRRRLVCDNVRVDELADRVAEKAPSDLCIDGQQVPIGWACSRLPDVLAGLPALDRQLLLGFHEGFCCAELAHRFGRTEECVKSRIHRARRRVRTEFECLVRAADELDGSGTEGVIR